MREKITKTIGFIIKRFTISIILFAALLLNSCTQQNRAMDLAQQNVVVIRGMYDSFAKGDIPPVLEAMHPNIEWREAEGNPYADGTIRT